MCGIIGCISDDNAVGFITKGLKKIEYRGYDSWGVAIMNGAGIDFEKRVGSIGSFSEELSFKGKIGIGHTRWATHGGVTNENAHPHFSMNNRIAVVHNGIIENYEELKDELVREGYRFTSETDTEVVPNLIERECMKGYELLDACSRTVKQLKGSYTLGIMSARDPDRLIAVKNASPLIIGIGDEKVFFASDIIAFLDNTNRVITLEDDDIADLKMGQIKIYNNGSEVYRQIETVDWSSDMAVKNGFEYFMLKEIYEQREKLKDSVIQDDRNLKRIANTLRGRDNILILGAGTSYHAGMLAEYNFSDILPMQAKLASEFEHFKNRVKENTGIIAISQSGETADLLSALNLVKNKRPYVLSICNRQGSTLSRMSDDLLYTNCGPEIAVAATKSYTGQIAVLSLLYNYLIGDLEAGKKSIKMIADSLTGVINENSDKLQEITDKYINARDFYFIGRGAGYPTALEGALKLKEISYLHAEGMGGGEMKHGTLSLIENGVPCIVVAPKDKTYAEMISNAREINARGGDIIGVSSEKNDVFKYWLKTPDNPIAEIVPLQLLAYNSAVKRGYNPDKPRNLAKSVTVK